MKISRLPVLVLALGFASPLFAADHGDPNKKLASPDKAYRQVQPVATAPVDPLRQYEEAMRPIYDMTIREATTGLQKDPNNAALYARRATAHASKKDYKSARPDFDRSLKLDPSQNALYGKRAIAHYMLKNYDKSWQDVHEAEKRGVPVPAPLLEALKKTTKRDK